MSEKEAVREESAMAQGHTPGPWEVRDLPSAGLQVWAAVNIGRHEGGGVLQPVYNVSLRPQLQVGEDGRVTMMLSYEDWRQFPSVDFEAMQQANAKLIAAAPDLLTVAEVALQSLEIQKNAALAPYESDYAPLRRVLAAAIAKARGESS